MNTWTCHTTVSFCSFWCLARFFVEIYLRLPQVTTIILVKSMSNISCCILLFVLYFVRHIKVVRWFPGRKEKVYGVHVLFVLEYAIRLATLERLLYSVYCLPRCIHMLQHDFDVNFNNTIITQKVKEVGKQYFPNLIALRIHTVLHVNTIKPYDVVKLKQHYDSCLASAG